MKEELRRDIEKFAEENREAIFRDIARLVAIDSVRTAPEDGAPFGKGPRDALELGLRIAGELGLETVNCGGMIGYASVGKGDRYLATITHLDVVPAGTGWLADPFTMREKDGWLIGRGVMDDKGPSVLCLYALKYLKDRGEALKYPVRALLGISEETGMEDVDYYLKNYPAPLFCFSPDANFPLCNGEKGIYHGRMISKLPMENIVDIRGGVAANAVPSLAEAWIRAEGPLSSTGEVEAVEENGLWHLTAHGVGGHASMPEGTQNAIGLLVDYILENRLAGESEKAFLQAVSQLNKDTGGVAMRVPETIDKAADKGRFGPLTLVGGVIGVEKGRMFQTLDSRYPTGTSGEKIAAAVQAAAGDTVEVTVGSDAAPFYVPADSPEVLTCLEAYAEITGDRAEPYTIGGGTYARHFPNAVSFGPEHPERPMPDFAGPIHGAEEAASKEWLLEALKVYILTLMKLEELEF